MIVSLAAPEDAEELAELVRVALPERLITASAIRYQMETAPPEDEVRMWKAEVSGRIVGRAFGSIDSFASGRASGAGGVVVAESHRGRGIGGALWDVLSRHFDAIGVRRVVSLGHADDASSRFARRCGFTLASAVRTSALDPRTLASPPVPPPGVEIVPMSRFEAGPTIVYAADHESALDEPGPWDASGMTYELWRRTIWDHPDCDHDLSVVAIEGGAVVGTSFLNADRPTGRAVNSGTGVVRACRGRGLGLLMKRYSLAWAAAAGITRVITQNDETNAPMLAINERLGYRLFSEGKAWVLER